VPIRLPHSLEGGALEDRFIDLSFPGWSEGTAPEEVKQYIRFIVDRRLIQLSLKPSRGTEKNSLAWVDHIVFGDNQKNFFEAAPVRPWRKGDLLA